MRSLSRKQHKDAFEHGRSLGLAAFGGVRAHLQFSATLMRGKSVGLRAIAQSAISRLMGRQVGNIAAIELDLSRAGAWLAEDRHHQR